MDTMKIKAVLTAVRLGSLSKAAEKFSYTPSALSHVADSLESELGVRILKRTSTGVSLTEEGILLLEKMESLEKAEEELLFCAKELSNQQEITLKIGTYSSVSTHLLPELLMAFRFQHPNVRVSVSVSDSLRNWLENGVADVIFADESAFGENEWVHMMDDPFLAVVPADLFPDDKRTVLIEELYEHTFVATNDHTVLSRIDEKRFRDVLRVNSSDDGSVLSLVKEGLGVAILPSLAIKKRTKGIRTKKLEPEIKRTLGFAYRKNALRSKGVKTFVEFLKHAALR